MATSKIKISLDSKRGKSTVSFKDADGTPDATNGPAALADVLSSNIESRFGKIENASSGGYYTAIIGGANANYYSILIFGYNSPYIYRFVYRNGEYYSSRIKDMAWV